jgi:transposase
MKLIALLNRCYHFKGFVYESARLGKGPQNSVEVRVRVRRGSRPYCAGCGERCAGYDRLPERRFEFIPVWGFAVFFLYARRRVECKDCGIVAELLPWAEGKQTLTNAYMQFLANWARKLSWLEVARSFHTSWQKVFHSVEWLVTWGLQRRVLGPISAIGVDEIAYSRGHKYLTLVYQIEAHNFRGMPCTLAHKRNGTQLKRCSTYSTNSKKYDPGTRVCRKYSWRISGGCSPNFEMTD